MALDAAGQARGRPLPAPGCLAVTRPVLPFSLRVTPNACPYDHAQSVSLSGGSSPRGTVPVCMRSRARPRNGRRRGYRGQRTGAPSWTWTPHESDAPAPLSGATPGLAYSRGAALPAGRGRKESRAGVVLAGSPLPASALPPVAWPVPTAPLDGMVCGPPVRRTNGTTAMRWIRLKVDLGALRLALAKSPFLRPMGHATQGR